MSDSRTFLLPGSSVDREKATGWTIRVWFPAETGNFSLRYRVQTGIGSHPAYYPTGTGNSYPASKAAGAWSWPLTSM